jgi:hypothetical protein
LICVAARSVGQRVEQYVLCTLTQRVWELDVKVDQNVTFSVGLFGVGQSVSLESFGGVGFHDFICQVDRDFFTT